MKKSKFTNYKYLYNTVIRNAKNLTSTLKYLNIETIFKKHGTHCFILSERVRERAIPVYCSILANSKLLTDPAAWAEEFNNFFSPVACNITTKINPTKKAPDLHNTH